MNFLNTETVDILGQINNNILDQYQIIEVLGNITSIISHKNETIDILGRNSVYTIDSQREFVEILGNSAEFAELQEKNNFLEIVGDIAEFAESQGIIKTIDVLGNFNEFSEIQTYSNTFEVIGQIYLPNFLNLVNIDILGQGSTSSEIDEILLEILGNLNI